MMAEITETEEKPMADTTQSHWDVVTPAGENEHDGEDSLENHKPDETNAEQAIVPGRYETKNVDDPKNGATAHEIDETNAEQKIIPVAMKL